MSDSILYIFKTKHILYKKATRSIRSWDTLRLKSMSGCRIEAVVVFEQVDDEQAVVRWHDFRQCVGWSKEKNHIVSIEILIFTYRFTIWFIKFIKFKKTFNRTIIIESQRTNIVRGEFRIVLIRWTYMKITSIERREVFFLFGEQQFDLRGKLQRIQMNKQTILFHIAKSYLCFCFKDEF